jgi:N-acetylglucosamine malate deacetylase 2
VPVWILVVAAHPDDEVIGAARLLIRAPRAAVVHLTDGAPRDPSLRPPGSGDRAAYARLRRQEAVAALAEAGLGADDVVGLGGVDQEAALELPRLARDLAEVLRRVRPRVVVAHPYEGGHPDHDAAALAARAAMVLLRRRGDALPTLAEMTSYHAARGGGLATGVFLPGGPPGIVRALLPRERLAKRRMLDRHASQRDVLAAFGVDAERYRRAPPLDPRDRPHAGALHYESLGWITFERFREAALDGLRALGIAEDAWA